MNRQCCRELPGGYEQALCLDLQNDSKLALLVNGLAVAIAAVMLAAGLLLGPPCRLFASMPATAALLVCMVLYMVLHELAHGACMKLFGACKVRFGFTGLYAFAGSDEYFPKGAYIAVALAPLVVWGLVLLAFLLCAGPEGFWLFYLLQLVNVSGAAGDLYVTARFIALPPQALVQDTGVFMRVFLPG